MTNILDRPTTYRSAPRAAVVASLRMFPEQCDRAFRGARAVRFPATYRSVSNVVVCGMGGSTLGTDVLRSAFADELKVPLTIVNGYHLPASVGKKTLLLLSSYSGSTEEVLHAAREGFRRGARMTGLTVGGPLGALFRRQRLPWYRINGSANPAGQPRMGLGYSTLGQIGLLSKLGLLRIRAADVAALLTQFKNSSGRNETAIPSRRNPAKSLAMALQNRMVLLVAAEHLAGSAHAFANQLNETAKVFAVPFVLPEINHHLLEGLRFPRTIRRSTAVFFDSRRYDPRIRKRLQITNAIVRRYGLRSAVVVASGSTRLQEAFDVLALAGYTSLYLSTLNSVNPLAVPTVNEFKRRLAAAG